MISICDWDGQGYNDDAKFYLSEISFKRHSRSINFWKNASKVEATLGEIFSIITIVFNEHSDNNIIIKIKTLNFSEKPKISYDIHLD